MVIGGQNSDGDNEESSNIPEKQKAGNSIQEMRTVYIDSSAECSKQIGQQYGMPPFDCIAREREVGLTKDEISAKKVGCSTHCEDANNHKPPCDPRHPSCDARRRKHRHP